jgi:hypothetical protein
MYSAWSVEITFMLLKKKLGLTKFTSGKLNKHGHN